MSFFRNALVAVCLAHFALHAPWPDFFQLNHSPLALYAAMGNLDQVYFRPINARRGIIISFAKALN